MLNYEYSFITMALFLAWLSPVAGIFFICGLLTISSTKCTSGNETNNYEQLKGK